MKNNISKTYLNLAICVLVAMAVLPSCTKKNSVNPTISTISPGKGSGGDIVTLTGSGLANIKTAVFDLGDVPVAFNPNFNTDKAVIFRVPAAANVGDQHIVFTTFSGYQFSVKFTILPIPSFTSVFPSEWSAGNTVTITGNYLGTVNHVAFSASSDTATIVSETPTQLVVTMPASSVTNTKLVVTNDVGTSTSNFSLLNMDQELIFFTESFGSKMQDWSWDNSSSSTDFAVSGTRSLKEVFSAGGGQGLSFHYDDTLTLSNYQYLSFWVKGGSADNTIKIFPDAIVTGAGSSLTVAVPAGVWTYITAPMSAFSATTTAQRFDFQITGPTTTQTLYFDNVILVKQ
jgi:IPT/TIG domain